MMADVRCMMADVRCMMYDGSNLLLIYLIIQKCVTQICIIEKILLPLHPELETIKEKEYEKPIPNLWL